MAQTVAQRKAAERQRHRDAGRVGVLVWVYPPDRQRLARYVAKMNKERA